MIMKVTLSNPTMEKIFCYAVASLTIIFLVLAVVFVVVAFKSFRD